MSKQKIFGLGLSRTGTTSLTIALKNARYNIIHYPTQQELFSSSNDGATDIPVTIAYKELDKKFPGSKFVYTIRDKEEWIEALRRYINRKSSTRVSESSKAIRRATYGTWTFNDDEWELYSNSYDFWLNDITQYFKDRPSDFIILNIVNRQDNPSKLYNFLNIKKTPPARFQKSEGGFPPNVR